MCAKDNAPWGSRVSSRLKTAIAWLRGIPKPQLLMAVCLILVAARLLWPEIKVDGITVWLVVVAAALFLLPELRVLLPYIERIKVGPFEATLREGIQELTREVQEAQASYVEEGRLIAPQRYEPQVEEVMADARRDPRSAFLWLSTKMETEVRQALERAGLPGRERYMPFSRQVEAGVKAGVLPEGALPAFRDFWTMRNRIVHDFAFEVPESTILSLISLGTELLKMLATTEADEQGNAEQAS